MADIYQVLHSGQVRVMAVLQVPGEVHMGNNSTITYTLSLG